MFAFWIMARRRSLHPVPAHQLTRPIWLAHFSSGGELAEVRLDVDDGRAIDRIQAADLENPPIDADQPTRRHTDPVRPVLPALRENTDQGPVRIATWTARGRLDLVLCHAVENV